MDMHAPAARPAEPKRDHLPLSRTFALLEFIADRASATVKEASAGLGYPIPSVYRMAGTLTRAGYLVHMKGTERFELGYAPRRMTATLNSRPTVPPALKAIVAGLHEQLHMAAYFAVHRGSDVVIAHIADCAQHPGISPSEFHVHMAAHATAFGKIMLAGMSEDQRNQYLQVHGMRPIQAATITDPARLEAHLREIMLSGIAWEHAEFLPATTCVAAAVHNPSGLVVGSAAVSAPTLSIRGKERVVEQQLRAASNEISRYFRVGDAPKRRAR